MSVQHRRKKPYLVISTADFPILWNHMSRPIKGHGQLHPHNAPSCQHTWIAISSRNNAATYTVITHTVSTHYCQYTRIMLLLLPAYTNSHDICTNNYLRSVYSHIILPCQKFPCPGLSAFQNHPWSMQKKQSRLFQTM